MTKLSYDELERKLEAAEEEKEWLKGVVGELENANALYNDVLSVSPVGIGLFDDRTFSWINRAMGRMFGYEGEDDYLGKTSRILYAAEEDYHRIGRMYENLKAGEVVQFEVEFRRKNGTTFWGLAELSCPDPTRPMKKVILAVADITEKKEAEAEREEKEKLAATVEMAGAVCHELNQPLQALFVYSDLLVKDMKEGSPGLQSAQMIRSQLTRISGITQKLMGITRYETVNYYGSSRIVDIARSSDRSKPPGSGKK